MLATTVMSVAIAVLGQATPAPPERQTPPDEIVVTARPTSDTEEANRFVREVAPRLDYDTPMARFAEPVCVAAGGLPTRLLRSIADRMTRLAVGAGLDVAADGCIPNVLVIFAPDPARQIQPMLNRRPALFHGLDHAVIGRLKKTDGPALAWSIAATVGRDGVPLAPGADGVPTQQVSFPTRLYQPVRRDIGLAVVMIDRRSVAGRTTTQLADYAAMRAFTDARPGGGGRSILSLFDADPSPDTATPFDLAYLRAYYRMSPAQRNGAQRQALTRALTTPGKR